MTKKLDKKLVGKRIRAARLHADMTQTELSVAIGGPTSARRISQLETGARPVKLEELETMGKLFGIPWTQLQYGDDHDKAEKASDLVDSVFLGGADKWITVPLYSAGSDHQIVDQVPVLRAELIKMGAENLGNICLWEYEGELLFLEMTPLSLLRQEIRAFAEITIVGSYCQKPA